MFQQAGYQPGVGAEADGHMDPFHLQMQFPTKNGDCTNDITHDRGPQHDCWDHGAMNQWVNVHMSVDGVKNFAPTMGYFQRSDLPF